MRKTVLEEMAAWVDGEYRLGIADVGMPEFKQKTITVELPGGDFELALPRRESMIFTLRSSDIEPDIISDLGLCGTQKTLSLYTIDRNIVSACEKENNEINLTGAFLSWNPGDIKVGSDNKREYKYAAKTIQWKRNDTVILEHDVFSVSNDNRAALGF